MPLTEPAIAARGPGARAPTYQAVIAQDTAAPLDIFTEVAPTRVDVHSVPRSE